MEKVKHFGSKLRVNIKSCCFNFRFLVIVNSAIIRARKACLINRMSDQWSSQTAHLYRYPLFVLDKDVHLNKTSRNN